MMKDAERVCETGCSGNRAASNEKQGASVQEQAVSGDNRAVSGDNHAVSKAPGLYVNQRGDKTLVVEPDSASWAVIPNRQYKILENLEKPMFFQEIIDKNPGFSVDELRSLIEKFHTHGMVEVNWRKYFPGPQIMWKPLDSHPVYPMDFYFHTTDACNFRCKYCYAAAGGHGRTMSLDIMKLIIEKIFRDIPGSSIAFVFHGGEPLLLKDTIFRATEFAERTAVRYNKHSFYSMQTNGSLIDDAVIEYAKRHRVEIGVTLDGAPEIHDANRIYPDGRGTFNDVWQASERARSLGVGLGYICIVHRPEDYLRSYEFFVSRGIFSFNLRYSFAVGRAKQEYEFTLEKGKEMAMGLLSMLDVAMDFNRRTGIKVRMNDLDVMIRYLISKKRDYMCMRSPCGIGRSILSFGPDGEIYPCEEMSPYSELSCGNIKDPRPLTEIIDTSDVLNRFRERRIENIPKCSKCPWRRFCMGRCTHKTYHYFGDFMREDPSCTFFSTLFEELMWKISENKAVLEFA